ncbi:MAG: flagellar hook-associated protein FlgL [Planctomycetes bacterium]|nr:flagellar hook-associated protein FlgL [Planctomycetota bacterium]
MVFRVTQNLSYESAQQQVQGAYSRLYTSQLLVARGKRISKPSDDPNAISRLLDFKNRHGELQRYSQNASQGRAFVDSAAASLQEASTLIQQAREAVIQGLNGTLSASDHDTVATAVDGFLQDLISLANSKVGARFVFGGTATDQPPYELVRDASGQERVVYHGDDGRIVSEVGPSLSFETNIPGGEIFRHGARGATSYSGVTGVRAGLGTDNGVGVDELIARHGATALSGGSGLALGASSTTADTILGSHVIDIDAVAGTIALDGGPAQSFTGTETDYVLKGTDGELVHLDLTGLSAGFQGQVTATGMGDLSIDGGRTWTAISFSSNDRVVDSLNGSTLNVDTSAIRRAGTDSVSYGGTLDIFSALVAIRDGLRNADSTSDVGAALNRVRSYLDEFDAGHNRLLEGLSELGSLSSRLESAESRVDDLDVRLQELISKTEDVDISEAVIQMQQNETAYQSALLVTSRVNQLSLMNYL